MRSNTPGATSEIFWFVRQTSMSRKLTTNYENGSSRDWTPVNGQIQTRRIIVARKNDAMEFEVNMTEINVHNRLSARPRTEDSRSADLFRTSRTIPASSHERECRRVLLMHPVFSRKGSMASQRPTAPHRCSRNSGYHTATHETPSFPQPHHRHSRNSVLRHHNVIPAKAGVQEGHGLKIGANDIHQGKSLEDRWIEQGNPGWTDSYGAVCAWTGLPPAWQGRLIFV